MTPSPTHPVPCEFPFLTISSTLNSDAANSLQSLSSGIVFAVNLRIMMYGEGIANLAGLLREVEGSQILAWTGTGEPPVRGSDVDWVKEGSNLL